MGINGVYSETPTSDLLNQYRLNEINPMKSSKEPVLLLNMAVEYLLKGILSYLRFIKFLYNLNRNNKCINNVLPTQWDGYYFFFFCNIDTLYLIHIK